MPPPFRFRPDTNFDPSEFRYSPAGCPTIEEWEACLELEEWEAIDMYRPGQSSSPAQTVEYNPSGYRPDTFVRDNRPAAFYGIPTPTVGEWEASLQLEEWEAMQDCTAQR